jgi:hypothetical protein
MGDDRGRIFSGKMSSNILTIRETQCWPQRPRTEDKTYRYKGAERSKRVVVDAAPAACPVATAAAHVPAPSWYDRKVSEGTKGPIAYAFACQRVTLCKGGPPERTVSLSSVRWAIEQCFTEGKTELGMDHYEVRKYTNGRLD